MEFTEGAPSGPSVWVTSREVSVSHRQQFSSAASATAVTAAVAAVATAEDQDGSSQSRLEALNLMLPRAISITLSGRTESGGLNDKTNSITHEDGAPSGAQAATCVFQGYEALRAMRERAHHFRKGRPLWL